MVTLMAVRPEARASAITRSESMRRSASRSTLGSPRPPSALTMIMLRRRWAKAGQGSAAAVPAARKKRRSIVIGGGLLGRDRAIVGAGEAAAVFHRQQHRAQIGDVGDRIAPEHDEIGAIADRDHPAALALPHRHRA